MARVVRKVSGKAVRGQKKNKGILKSKRFWIISAIALVIVVAVGITIGILVNNDDTVEEVKVEDYFGQTHEYKGSEVKFEKISYSGLRLYTNTEFDDTLVEYAFFFATDLSTFYPKDLYDNDDKNLKKDVHEAMFNALVGLQYEIDKHNEGENDYDVKLYIVDTSQAAGSYNLNLLFDPAFGGSEEEETTIIFGLKSHDQDGIVKSYEGYKNGIFNDSISIFCNTFNKSTFETVINSSKTYMNLGFKDEKEN